MYKFVRIKNHFYNMTYESWFLSCSDAKTLTEFNDKYFRTEIRDGMKNVINEKKGKEHFNTGFGRMVGVMMEYGDKNMLEASVELEIQATNEKFQTIQSHGTIYLKENCAYFPHTEDIEILETIEKSEMIWPEYTVADIKITQWELGNHFYARIGKMHVTDDKGNQKWNTYDYAYEMALKFLRKLNTQ